MSEHATPDIEPVAGNLETTTVDTETAESNVLPEQTDNGVKPEDPDQDVTQDQAPVQGSPTEAGA